MEIEQATQLVSRRNTYIYAVLWSFIFGVLVASLISVSPIFSCLLIALAGAIFVIEKMHKKILSHEAVCIILALLCFGLGALRYDIKDFHESVMPSGEGEVRSEPEHRDIDTRFVYEADNGERALVSTDMYSHAGYGDRIRVGCHFKWPEAIAEENGRTFDYPKFLSKDDVYYTCSFAKIEILSKENGNSFQTILFKIKNGFVQQMKVILPEPESSLLAGLIVAGKQALPKSVLQDFQNAGVSHIVVLSGYNITVVAEFFLVLLGFLSISLRKRTVLAVLGILLFVLMAGGSASIVRAAIMALVVLLGKVVHRGYSAPRTLLLAGTLMILWNPKVLVYDPSFHLSFLAMSALIYAEPIVGAWLAKMTWPAPGQASGQSRPLPSWLASLLATTIATQVVVLPYLLYSAGSVSIVSLVSNILILVFVPFTMLIGFLATLVAFVSTYLAWPLSFISHLLLKWILGVAHTLGSLPFASIKISHFSVWLTLISYASYMALGKHLYSRMKPPA